MELLSSFLVAVILFVVFIMPCRIIAFSIVKDAFKGANQPNENLSAHDKLPHNEVTSSLTAYFR